MSKYAYPIDTTQMMSSLKPMPRPQKDTGEKFPKHVVQNSSIGKSGITESGEEQSGTKDGQAELEVLKAILNREGYLTRLKAVARTVGKKFKPEVADVLDFVRASTLDVIDMIIRWREVKRDHDAAFMWNGINYLLKMSSDLDYLADYLAIKRWVGFPLIRNPFCVPYPLEEGQELLTEATINPKHIEKGLITDGFVLGGMSKRTMRTVYIDGEKQGTGNYDEADRGGGTASTANTVTSDSTKMSPYLSGTGATVASYKPSKSSSVASAAQSFIFNENMSKIRQAELVILAEEKKFGILSKDPDGRLMPRLQAMTRQAAFELKKDNKRPITEPAHTPLFAPHAASSDIGVAPPNWTPGGGDKAPAGDGDHSNRMQKARGNSVSLSQLANAAASEEQRASMRLSGTVAAAQGGFNHLYSEETDPTLLPSKRGQGKSGGLLAPLQTKGTETRRRRPLKTTLTSEMEFNRTRQIRTLSEKIEEINRLRESITEEKKKLDEELANKSTELSKASVLRPLNSDPKRVVKSAASNQTYGTEPPPSYTDIIGNSGSPPATAGKSNLRRGGSTKFNEEGSSKRLASPQQSPMLGRQGSRKVMSSAHLLDGSPSPMGSPQLGRGGSVKRMASSSHLERGSSKDNSEDERAPGRRAQSPSASPMIKQASRKRLNSADRNLSDTEPVGAGANTGGSSPLQRNRKRSNSISRTQFAEDVTVYGDAQEREILRKEAEILKLEVSNKTNELKKLNVEGIHSVQKLNHFVQDEVRIAAIKDAERHQKNAELSRDIERKRRLLTPQEGVRIGPPPEDPANMYDYYAIKVQSTIRGFIARCWIKWFRAMSIKAAIKLQSVMRGWFGRSRVRRLRKYYNAARVIQKNFRGWSTRGTSAAMAKKKNFGRSAVTIQRVWRGILGVRRAVSKRALDKAAKLAFEVVDARVLIVGDVKELARRILYAIEEPSTTTFPPDEVLYLIRLSVMVIQSARGNLGIAEYDFFNARNYDEIDGENLTWLQAAKMVNRAERFMRLVRLMAYGPGAKPPRLVQLPNAANLLFSAQARNPRWNFQTFETMGMGSKICVQLFKWLTSIVEVAARQQEFLALIASSFPDWLPKLHELQKSARAAEQEIELNKKCMQLLNVFKGQVENDYTLEAVLEAEMTLVKRTLKDAKVRIRSSLSEIDKLKDDQSSREIYALEAMEKKVEQNQEELDDLVLQYHEQVQLAATGERGAIEALPDLRHRLTNQRLKLTELDGQRKVLQNQVEANRAKRKDPARLTPEIMVKTQIAGEEKANYVIAVVRARTMLQSVGVKHAENLPMHLVDIYEELEREEAVLKAQARKAYVEAESERKIYDDYLGRSMAANELKEQRAKDKMAPSDQELQEERMEDDRHAIEERTKHRQYIPDAVLHVSITRPRPVVIALSRDLSAYSKRKIHQEVTKLMPGLFISLSSTANMGIDIHSMQQVLDSGKCVIMEVDPGLTRLSRDTFLQALEITNEALIPRPFVAIAVGDEDNKRSTSGAAASYHGVEKNDLSSVLMDGAIKTSMEGKAWVIEEMQRPETRSLIQQRAGELVPASPSFGMVAEGLFVALSENNVYKFPDANMAAMSWRVTRSMLIEPRHIIEKMKQMRRGAATLRTLECLQAYIHHPDWPALYSADRNADVVLHLFAYYVEQYVSCEQGCRAGGGVPLQALTKSSMRGIQTVVVVKDTAETAEEADLLVSGGWKMGALRLVRTALQDMRVLKTVMKIDGTLYTLSVYRDCGSVYFEAYDAATSDIHMTMVSLDDLPTLLIPNAFTASTNVNLDPPQTPAEMYSALCKLLRFDKGITARQKKLVCRREVTFLGNITRKLNGHMILIKSYEAALGELYFTAYMPEFSAHLTLTIDAGMRLAMQENADKTESKESEHVLKEDARPLLPFMIDRLKLSPSRPMILSKGIDLHDGFRKNQGLNSMVRSMGFTLKARVHGGVGRILARRVVTFYNVLHLVEIRISAPMQLLDVSIYEPRKQHTMRLRLSRYMRRVLLGPISDDLRLWHAELMRRIKLDWRGEHKIRLDRSVFNAVRRIANQRVIIKFIAVDENSILVTFMLPFISKLFSATLTKEDVIRTLLFESPAERVQRQNGTTVYNPVVYGILQEMKLTNNVPSQELSEATHPTLFEKTFDYYLTDRNKLVHLADQLAMLMSLVNPNDPSFGFHCRDYPLKVRFTETEDEEENKPALNMALRTNSWFVAKEHNGTCADLVRTRKQHATLNMEEALNAMALEKSLQATAKALSVMQVAETVEKHLEELGDPVAARDAIQDATQSAAKDMLDNIHGQLITRFAERNEPGYMQSKHEIQMAAEAEEKALADEEERQRLALITEEDRAIVGDNWRDVFEAGAKVHYREGKVRWNGHVGVKVASAPCWLEEDGLGKKYKFTVYEPNVAQSFEGFIRSRKHLREILGLHGQDLADPAREREMLMFVSKFRMDVVVNKKTWDGVDVEEGAPPYRIEFQSDRMYNAENKVTPVNAATEEDEEFNKAKLMGIDNARGKKIIRLVRRVSGLLMQLTVFELPGTVAEAAYGITKAQLQSAAVVAATADMVRAQSQGGGMLGDDDSLEASPSPSPMPPGRGINKMSPMAVVPVEPMYEEGDAGEDVQFGELTPPMPDEKTAEELREIEMRKGFVEQRLKTTVLERYPPPAFRIVAYDPKSKRKLTLGVEPQAIIEVSGGVFSPYLDPSKRKELARVVCDSLVLIFPSGKPFELLVPWSGAKKDISTAVVTAADTKSKMSERSGAERVLKRPGRLFRSAMKISKYELLVSMYAHTVSQAADSEENADNRQLIFNFYSPAVSEAAEVVVKESEQVDRLGRPVLHFGEGAQRAVAIRRLCKFFRAEIMEDIMDPLKKTLLVVLLPPEKGFITDYMQVSVPPAGEDVRPVGIPGVFFPLNTCGKPLHREGMSLQNRDRSQPNKDYLVTVYTKSMSENVERGLVIKLYDRAISETAILHVGASELIRICNQFDEPDLLRDVVYAQNEEDAMKLDDIENGFSELTAKGELQRKTKALIGRVMEIVLGDLGFYISPQETIVPYIKSGPRGIFPS